MSESQRRRDERGSQARADARRGVARLKIVLGISVVAIAVLALEIVVGGDGSDENSTLLDAPPEELMGLWVTDNPRYADRTFLIESDRIELDLGEEGGMQSHSILAVRLAQGQGSRTYEITYDDSGGEWTMAVHLYPDGVLRLKNPAEVAWRRQPTR